MQTRGRGRGRATAEEHDMTELHTGSRSARLHAAIHALLAATPEVEAAAVVTFDGLPMASALPASMDEDRVAAMSAALLSLGERAAEGLGRGGLSQVYVEGESGTVFLVSADDEAVLVAVAARGAKIGMMLYEVKRAAVVVAQVLRSEDPEPAATPSPASHAPASYEPASYAPSSYAPPSAQPPSFLPAPEPPGPVVPPQPGPPPALYGPVPESVWSTPVSGAHALPGEPSAWS